MFLVLPHMVHQVKVHFCSITGLLSIPDQYDQPDDLIIVINFYSSEQLWEEVVMDLSEINLLCLLDQLWFFAQMIKFRHLFLRMVSNEAHQHTGIVELLLHFGWKWVGFLAVDNESGEIFLQKLQLLLSQRGNCYAFSERIPKATYIEEYINMMQKWIHIHQVIIKSKANAVVVYGEIFSMFSLQTLIGLGEWQNKTHYSTGKVWIMTAQLDFASTAHQMREDIHVFHGSLSFTVPSGLMFLVLLHMVHQVKVHFCSTAGLLSIPDQYDQPGTTCFCM
ncbi:hypothetical protein E2320_022493 [Naja naja]|nr:hypothetical protein E2320_022493 [Naja naja]